MATNEEVLTALNGEVAPLTMSQIATKMGVKPNQINSILSRLLKKGQVSKDENSEYQITQEGVELVTPANLETERLTPMKIFEDFGKTIGISTTQLPLISNYIFTGGKFDDLVWVSKGLGDMNVPADKLKAWWNSWRVYLKKGVPEELAESLGVSSTDYVKKEKERVAAVQEEIKKEWDIGPDDLPVNVGPDAGRLTYQDAVAISKLRAAAKIHTAVPAASTAQATPVDPVEQIGKVMTLLKEHFTGKENPKPMVVVPTEDGGYELQEVDPSKPMRLSGSRQEAAAPVHWIVEPDGSTRQLQPGEPIVIKAPLAVAPRDGQVKSWIVHDSDGSTEEYIPGKPIVIKPVAAAPAAGTSPMMINAQTPDGKPFVIDIESAFRWDDHMAKRKREDESHEMKLDISRGIKDLISKGARALDNMTPDEEGGS